MALDSSTGARRARAGVLAATLACAAPSAATLPEPFTAAYTLHYNGMRIGRMTRELARAPDGVRTFRSETRATGLAALLRRERVEERSRWTFDGHRLRPLEYHYARTGGDDPRVVTVRFDWQTGRIANTVNDQTWHMRLEPEVFDRLLYQVALMHDLDEGVRSLEYRIADGGRIKTYRLVVEGRERIQTPLGELETVKLQRVRERGKRTTVLWCAPALHYLPVRVDNTDEDGDVTRAMIDTLSGLGPG